jgi:hypothetical protein
VRIPSKLALAGRTWRVRWKRRLRLRGQALRGLATFQDCTISLDPDEHPAVREQTLLHEALHVLWPPGIVGGKLEEQLIEGLEGPLHRFLEDNALALWAPKTLPSPALPDGVLRPKPKA